MLWRCQRIQQVMGFLHILWKIQRVFNPFSVHFKYITIFVFSISIMPWGYMIFKMNSLVHLECNFPEKKWSRESYKSTIFDGLKIRCEICRSCHILIFPLKLHVFLYASRLNSSNLLCWSFHKGPTKLKSKLTILIVQYTLCSFSTGRW